jgi:hypothetical protein
VAVAGSVDLFDPGPQPGNRLLPGLSRQLPPGRRQVWVVTVTVTVGLAWGGELPEGGSMLLNNAADAGRLAGELGQPTAGPGVVVGSPRSGRRPNQPRVRLVRAQSR